MLDEVCAVRVIRIKQIDVVVIVGADDLTTIVAEHGARYVRVRIRTELQ